MRVVKLFKSRHPNTNDRTHLPVILVAALTITFLSCIAKAESIKVFTEHMPPYNYSNEQGTPTGFCTDLVREIFNRSNITLVEDISLVPWARGYNFLENKSDVMLFSMTRSAEREPKFQWVGPLAKRTIWLWKLKARKDISVTNLTEAKQYVVGGVYEFASSKYLQELGLKVEMVSTIEQNWKKLLLNRLDLVSALELEAAYSMQRLNRHFDELQKVAIVDDRYEYYLAINPQTDISYAKKLQSALDQMKADGSYDKLRLKYLH